MRLKRWRNAPRVLVLLVGLLLGHLLFPSTDQHTSYQVIHVNHDVPGPTVTQVVHDAPAPGCLVAINESLAILRAGKQYEETLTGLEEILSEVRQVANTGSTFMANEVQTKLNNLEPKTIHAAEILGGNLTPFYAAVKACKESYND
jgi:hypothetical protein